MQTIDCHDCGKQVSFSALSCPHCGSREPTGSYAFSDRERRRFRVEARNDWRMIGCGLVGCFVGGIWGIAASSGWLALIFLPLIYALIGAAVGFAFAVVLNWFVGPAALGFGLWPRSPLSLGRPDRKHPRRQRRRQSPRSV